MKVLFKAIGAISISASVITIIISAMAFLPRSFISTEQAENIVDILLFLIIACSLLYYANFYKTRSAKSNLDRVSQLEYQKEEIEALYEEITATEQELRDKYDELVQYKVKLEESQECYKKMFEASNEALWEWNIVTDEKYYSENLSKMFRIGEDQSFDLNLIFGKIHAEDLYGIFEEMERIKNGSIDLFEDVLRFRIEENEYRWYGIKVVALKDGNGKNYRLLGSFVDIHDKKTHQDEMKRIAFYDTLTELHNKRWFIDYFENVLNDKSEGYLVLMDIDNFKLINDVFGHPVGDNVLKLLADNIKSIGKDFKISKFGGDEFICCIMGTLDFEEYYKVILKTFNSAIHYQSQEFVLAISSGVVKLSGKQDVYDCIKRAEIAMYKAKEMGKNKYVIFDEKMNEEIIKLSKMENALKNALAQKEFSVFYQPQYLLENNILIGYEALIRWYSPEFGFVTPDSFIGLAESTGIINDIGLYVIKEACKFVLELDRRGLNECAVSVNVSPVQLSNQEFEERVMEIVNYYKIKPNRLCFEVTETAVMQSFEENVQKLERIREYGFKVSLDDFGTGYSSLSYLKNIPVNEVKIDRSFIKDICGSDIMHSKLVKAIIDISHDFGFNVVAEGVEDLDQMEVLLGYKCDRVQGFYFSKPVPTDEALKISEKIVN